MPPTLSSLLSAKFVVFDGPDGCGKSTQLQSLIARLEREGAINTGAVGGGSTGEGASLKIRRLREPGGTSIGEQIRTLLLSTDNDAMDVRCEMLLYMASRAQLVAEQIKPALAAGECVLSDRFASSTLAYQGGGGGMDLQQILDVAQAAVGNFDDPPGKSAWPHLTILFDLDIDQAMARLNPLLSTGGGGGGGGLFQDRIEQRDREYFQRVRQNYLWQAQKWPDRYRIVDAGKSIAQVEKQVLQTIRDFFT